MRRLLWVLALSLSLPLFADEITGKWKGQMDQADRETVLQLKLDGGKITGTMSGPQGEPRPITRGEWKDGKISLTVASEWEGNPVKLLVDGTVKGNEMRLTVSSEGGEWSTGLVVKKVAE